MKISLPFLAGTNFISLAAAILLFNGSILGQGIGNGQGKQPVGNGGPVNLPFWKLIGNATDSTSFIGTTNSTPLNIKINNVLKGTFTGNGFYLFDGIYVSKSAVIDSILQVFSVQVSDVLTAKTINAEQYFQNDTVVDLVGMQMTVGSLQTTVINQQSQINVINDTITSIQNQVSGIQQTQWKGDTVTLGNIYYDGGKVGIGTSAPAAKLDVYGSQRITGDLYVGGEVMVSDKFSAKTVNSDTAVASKQLFVNHNLLLGADSLTSESDISSRVNVLKIQSSPTANYDVAISAENNTRVGIGTKIPTEKLTVDGNMNVTGSIKAANIFVDTTTITRIKTSRIVPLDGDSVIRFGDSTLWVYPSTHRITTDNNKGMAFGWYNNNDIMSYSNAIAIGKYAWAKGTNTIAIGNNSIASGNNSIVIGSFATNANAPYSIAIGKNVSTDIAADNSVVIGKGSLNNDKSNSLMVGFNTFGNTPTLFVGPADGTFNSTGNIGIGTSVPLHKLDVRGTLSLVDHLVFNGSSTNGVINWPHDTKLWFRTNNIPGDESINYNEIMVITGDGKLGLGTTDPDQKLTIKGGGIGFDFNSIDKKLYSPADGDLEWMTHNAAGVHGFAVSHQGSKKVYLNTNGDSYFIGGNVGIGTESPLQTLDINGRMNVNGGVIQRGGSAINTTSDLGLYSRIAGNYLRFVTNGGSIRFYSDDGIGTTVNMTIEPNGNVGFGTTCPDEKLTVDGKIKARYEVVVQETGGFCDYVFEEKYKRPSYLEKESFYKTNKHLYNMPSAKEIESNGLPLVTAIKSLTLNAEENSLDIIELYKRLIKLENENKEKDKKIQLLEKKIKQ